MTAVLIILGPWLGTIATIQRVITWFIRSARLSPRYSLMGDFIVAELVGCSGKNSPQIGLKKLRSMRVGTFRNREVVSTASFITIARPHQRCCITRC